MYKVNHSGATRIEDKLVKYEKGEVDLPKGSLDHIKGAEWKEPKKDSKKESKKKS